ncbi:MAG: RusA family crossover junction endodeoxyribonuclease [Neisseriaceae bacterium]|jgi:Holliday junction resolvase RusA-like endonuclease
MIIEMAYPVSNNIYYRRFRNITLLSKTGRIYKQRVKLTNLRIKPTSHDVTLSITIHPKQKKDSSAYSQIIDLDNGLKCILDSLIGVVYHDDKQVKSLQVNYGTAKVGGGVTVVVSKFYRDNEGNIIGVVSKDAAFNQ